MVRCVITTVRNNKRGAVAMKWEARRRLGSTFRMVAEEQLCTAGADFSDWQKPLDIVTFCQNQGLTPDKSDKATVKTVADNMLADQPTG